MLLRDIVANFSRRGRKVFRGERRSCGVAAEAFAVAEAAACCKRLWIHVDAAWFCSESVQPFYSLPPSVWAEVRIVHADRPRRVTRVAAAEHHKHRTLLSPLAYPEQDNRCCYIFSLISGVRHNLTQNFS